jgi:N-acetylglucosamine kinase-like BadF-type ATPase
VKQAVLAIDGGNTKSVAVVACTDGTVLGHAVGGCGDIYNAPSEEEALATIAATTKTALATAGVEPADVVAAAGSLAGADWPEDFELFEREVPRRVGLSCPIAVVNDGLGPLRLGDRSGVGVAVALGTGIAVGARGPSGKTWNASFWLFSIAILGQRGLQAIYRADLGLGPPTSLTQRLTRHFGVVDTESLLHRLTERQKPVLEKSKREIGTIVLDEDAAGDEVAVGIVDAYASELAGYALVAAKKTSLTGRFSLVLTGGVLLHRTSSLAARLVEHVREGAGGVVPVVPAVAPVAGSVLDAISLTGGDVSEALQQRVVSAPELQTLGRTAQALPDEQIVAFT